jgi:hypothetical protein
MLEIRIDYHQICKKVGFQERSHRYLVVDAQSGAMRSYTIAKTPKWVDRIQPLNLSKTN